MGPFLWSKKISKDQRDSSSSIEFQILAPLKRSRVRSVRISFEFHTQICAKMLKLKTSNLKVKREKLNFKVTLNGQDPIH